MQVKLAVLADYAATTDQGKLVLGGVFDQITLSQLPGTHSMMAVAVRITASAGEGGSHDVSLRLIDPDGNDTIPPFEGTIEIRERELKTGGGAQLVVHLNEVQFTRAGAHHFEIVIDGEPAGTIDLLVRGAATPASAPENPTRH